MCQLPKLTCTHTLCSRRKGRLQGLQLGLRHQLLRKAGWGQARPTVQTPVPGFLPRMVWGTQNERRGVLGILPAETFPLRNSK